MGNDFDFSCRVFNVLGSTACQSESNRRTVPELMHKGMIVALIMVHMAHIGDILGLFVCILREVATVHTLIDVLYARCKRVSSAHA